MFRKPYKVKTSTTMKGSERRELKSLIQNQFPTLTMDDINSLIPGKGEMNQVKAMTHAGRQLMVYYSNANPIFFILEDLLYPTVYTLWMHTNLLPTITTLPPVLEKICNGADLMAPGIVVNDHTIKEMCNLKPNDICAIKILGNKSPIAVGVAIMSIDDLRIEGIKGKAVTVMHNYKDNLWASGNCDDLPTVVDEYCDEICEEVQSLNISDELLQNDETTNCLESSINSNSITECDDSPAVEMDNNNDLVPAYSMDEILYQSFMSAIKVHGKKIQLPLLISTFYSSYVLKSCPSELNLDIKKTTYKKLSVFLKKMTKEGTLQIKELTKGVESIVSINLESEKFKSFSLDPIFKHHLQAQKLEKSKEEDSSMNVQEKYKFPNVVELYVISAQVKKLFEASNLKKGDVITSSTIREVIKMYVKNNSLQNEANPREVSLDPLLSDCVLKKGDNRTTMTWEGLYESIVNNMPPAYEITFDGKAPVVKKGKLEPIKITIDTRTGNKKVTLIQNLETYGINPEKIAHHVQVAVAASTSITPTQSGKGCLVLIQGNQVLYLQKLFLDNLKVPKKYIQGLENVPGKKK